MRTRSRGADASGAERAVRDWREARAEMMRAAEERRRAVVAMREESRLSFGDIGLRLGVTRQRAHQLYLVAKARARKHDAGALKQAAGDQE